MNFAGSMLGRWLRLLIVSCKRIEYEMNIKFLRRNFVFIKTNYKRKMRKRKYLLMTFCSDKLKIN